MAEEINHNVILHALDKGYNKVVGTGGVFDNAYELGNHFLTKHTGKQAAAESLIKSQTMKGVVTGFITGLGGLPGLPANVAAALFLQLRLIATIAVIGGYYPNCPQVKCLAYSCLTNSNASSILKEVSMVVGEKITLIAIEKISTQTIARINKLVGLRLVAKYGGTRILRLGTLPVLGGIVCGAIDGIATKRVGQTAMELFIL